MRAGRGRGTTESAQDDERGAAESEEQPAPTGRPLDSGVVLLMTAAVLSGLERITLYLMKTPHNLHPTP